MIVYLNTNFKYYLRMFLYTIHRSIVYIYGYSYFFIEHFMILVIKLKVWFFFLKQILQRPTF